MTKNRIASTLAFLGIGFIVCTTIPRGTPTAPQIRITGTLSDSGHDQFKNMAILQPSHKCAQLMDNPPPDASVTGQFYLGKFNVENHSQREVQVKFVINGMTYETPVGAGARQCLAEGLDSCHQVNALAKIVEESTSERFADQPEEEHHFESHHHQSNEGEDCEWSSDSSDGHIHIYDSSDDGHLHSSDESDVDLD